MSNRGETLKLLTAIGLTPDEAGAFIETLKNDDGNRRHWTSEQLLKFRGLMMILWAYSFAVWLYVVAMQLRSVESVYWRFATWVPVRMDYLGEAAFLFSFLMCIMIVLLPQPGAVKGVVPEGKRSRLQSKRFL